MRLRYSLITVVSMLVLMLVVSPTSLADQSKGRGAVKDFEFAYKPAPARPLNMPDLSVCVLPLINSNRLDRHTKNIEKATRNLDANEIPRVLGIRYSGTGKPLNRFLLPLPAELTLQGAIESELRALGLDVLPPMDSVPPDNFRERTLVAMLDTMPEENIPDLVLGAEIEDFYFETTTGAFKLKMETFFVLEVTVFDTASREIIWEGTVEAGDLEKKAMFMGKEAVDNRLHAAFQDLIENVLRNNFDLQRALSGLG